MPKVNQQYINIYDEEEKQNWCVKFRCKESELVYAIKAVGNKAKFVKRFIEDQQKKH